MQSLDGFDSIRSNSVVVVGGIQVDGRPLARGNAFGSEVDDEDLMDSNARYYG